MGTTNIGHDDYMADKRAEALLKAPPMLGLTIRDYFAAQAMQGLCAAGNIMLYEKYAEQSYKLADALLLARTK